MKRYLDIFGDFLCNVREIMVISSLLCSVTYFLPGLFFTVLFLGIVLGVVPLVYGLVHLFQKQDK